MLRLVCIASVFCAPGPHVHPPGVDARESIAQRALVQQVARAVRCDVVLDRTVVEVLLAVGEEDPEHLAEAAGLGQHRSRPRCAPGRRRSPAQRADLGVTAHPRPLHRQVGHARCPSPGSRRSGHAPRRPPRSRSRRCEKARVEVRRGVPVDERHLGAAPTTISVWGKTAMPSASRYVRVWSGRSTATPAAHTGTSRRCGTRRAGPGTSSGRWARASAACRRPGRGARGGGVEVGEDTRPWLASAGSRCVRSRRSCAGSGARPARRPRRRPPRTLRHVVQVLCRRRACTGRSPASKSDRSVYRHSSVSCDGMGSAENSSNACLRRGAVNPAASGSAASACSSKVVVSVSAMWTSVGVSRPSPPSGARSGG